MNGQQPPTIQPAPPAPTPSQPTAPPPATPPTKGAGKIILIVVGVVILLVILALGIWYFLGQREQAVIQQAQQANLEQQLDDSLAGCENADNPEYCRRQAVGDFVDETGQGALCEKLTGEDRDSCYWDLAEAQTEIQFCEQIIDTERRQLCQDSLNRQQAIQDNNLSLCESIVDETIKSGCVQAIQGPITSDNCSQRGLSEEFCAELPIVEEAIAKQDPDICESLSDFEPKDMCLDLVLPGDRDFDGLNANQEGRYGTDDRNPDTDADGLNDYDEVNVYQTDPLNPDTDGDSFTDGQEVDGGYNPNGEGRL